MKNSNLQIDRSLADRPLEQRTAAGFRRFFKKFQDSNEIKYVIRHLATDENNKDILSQLINEHGDTIAQAYTTIESIVELARSGNKTHPNNLAVRVSAFVIAKQAETIARSCSSVKQLIELVLAPNIGLANTLIVNAPATIANLFTSAEQLIELAGSNPPAKVQGAAANILIRYLKQEQPEKLKTLFALSDARSKLAEVSPSTVSLLQELFPDNQSVFESPACLLRSTPKNSTQSGPQGTPIFMEFQQNHAETLKEIYAAYPAVTQEGCNKTTRKVFELYQQHLEGDSKFFPKELSELLLDQKTGLLALEILLEQENKSGLNFRSLNEMLFHPRHLMLIDARLSEHLKQDPDLNTNVFRGKSYERILADHANYYGEKPAGQYLENRYENIKPDLNMRIPNIADYQYTGTREYNIQEPLYKLS